MYGHVEKLAEEIRKGAASVEGVEAKLWQVRFAFLHKWLFAFCQFLQAQTYFICSSERNYVEGLIISGYQVLLTLTNNIRFESTSSFVLCILKKEPSLSMISFKHS